MQLIYTPENGDPQKFYMKDPSDLRGLEPEIVEEAGGAQWGTWLEWTNLLSRGGYRALRVLLWVFMMRTYPTLELQQVQPKLSELQFDFGDDQVEPGKDETEAPELSEEPATVST